jgi:hypothetical protein
MPPVRDDIRLLSLFHYVLAGFTGLFALFPLVYVVLGALMVGGVLDKGSDPPPAFLGFFVMGFGLLFLFFVVAWMVLLILAGRFLARQRHWIFCVVVAAISCTSFPLGTALGIFTLVTLTKAEVKALFAVPRVG